MIIIFIGPDKSGKTTVASAVADRYNTVPIKGSNMDDDRKYSELVNEVLKSAEDKKKMIICDRLPYPEDLIYSSAVEQKTSRFRANRYDIEHRMNELGCLIVFVNANIETLQERYEVAGGDKYLDFELMPVVISGYWSFLISTSLPYVTINTTYLTPEETAITVYKEVERMQK